MHPVLVADLVFIQTRFYVGVAVELVFGEHLAVVLHRVKQAAAGEGFDAAPALGEVIGQGFAAAFQVANSGQKLHRLRAVVPKNHGIHHAAQVAAGEVLVLFLDHHRMGELRGRDHHVDDGAFGVVVLAHHGQHVFGRQLLQHHHQRAIALGVGQLGQRRFGTADVTGGNQRLGFGNQGELVHGLLLGLLCAVILCGQSLATPSRPGQRLPARGPRARRRLRVHRRPRACQRLRHRFRSRHRSCARAERWGGCA